MAPAFRHEVFIMIWYGAHVFSIGGTILVRRFPLAFRRAEITSAEVAPGNSDHNSATAPVTKGAAALVPPRHSGLPSTPRLTISTPGAQSPRIATDRPRFVLCIGDPWRSQATTGIAHACRVMAELPMLA